MVAPVGVGAESGRVAKQSHSAPHNHASITSRNPPRNDRSLTDPARLPSLTVAPMRPKTDSTHQSTSQARLRIGPAAWPYPASSGFSSPPPPPTPFHHPPF